MTAPNADSVRQLVEIALTETEHVIQFGDDGCVIAHPLMERLDGSLFDCRVVWHGDDPGVRGRFWLHDDGTLGPAQIETP